MIERLIHAIFHRDESADLPVVSQIKYIGDYRVFLKMLPSLYDCPYCARRAAVSALSNLTAETTFNLMFKYRRVPRELTDEPNSP